MLNRVIVLPLLPRPLHVVLKLEVCQIVHRLYLVVKQSRCVSIHSRCVRQNGVIRYFSGRILCGMCLHSITLSGALRVSWSLIIAVSRHLKTVIVVKSGVSTSCCQLELIGARLLSAHIFGHP